MAGKPSVRYSGLAGSLCVGVVVSLGVGVLGKEFNFLPAAKFILDIWSW